MESSIQKKIYQIAYEERLRTLKKYNSVAGKCIETSDRITERLNKLGFNAHPYQVWCLYENFENCLDSCYEEHWVTYILYKGRRVYIDTTLDQFQWAFSKKLPEIYVSYKLPNFLLNRKPGKVTLDRCGWNDWYNYGNYINQFDYWG